MVLDTNANDILYSQKIWQFGGPPLQTAKWKFANISYVTVHNKPTILHWASIWDVSQTGHPSDFHFLAWVDRGIIPLHKNLLLQCYTYWVMAQRSQQCSYIKCSWYGALLPWLQIDKHGSYLQTNVSQLFLRFCAPMSIRNTCLPILFHQSIGCCSHSSILVASDLIDFIGGKYTDFHVQCR